VRLEMSRYKDDRGGGREPAQSSALWPDLNPIESAFAKLEALLRKAAEVSGVWDRIGLVLDAFTPVARYDAA
jgi:hypothetical protein